MLNKLSNFMYAAVLEVIMSYYNISLTDADLKISTITTTLGKYEYNRLPMGVCI